MGHAQTALVSDLERALNREIELYNEYNGLLIAERKALRKMNAEQVTELTRKRAVLAQALENANQRRLDLMQQFPESQGKRLTELVRLHCSPKQQKYLMPLIDDLKLAVAETRRSGFEAQQVVNFALKIVHGTLSILWSATQSAVNIYTKKGAAKQNYHPTRGREQSTLKKV